MPKPTLHTIYKHVDGGFYYVNSFAHSADDGSEWVAYSHLWPFENKQWIRRVEEWTYERFQQSTAEELAQIKAMYSPEHYRAIVTSNKEQRKAAQRA